MDFIPNSTEKRVLAIMINHNYMASKLTPFILSKKIGISISYLYNILRNLKYYGLIEKSIGGAWHIVKNKKGDVIKLIGTDFENPYEMGEIDTTGK